MSRRVVVFLLLLSWFPIGSPAAPTHTPVKSTTFDIKAKPRRVVKAPPRPTFKHREPVKVLDEKKGLESPDERIRICSYNIQHYQDGVDDRYKTTLIVKRQTVGAAGILDEINADIVVLQEIENDVALKRLNGAMKNPYPVAYISDFPSDHFRINVAVLSRLPLENVRELEFKEWADPDKPPRGALAFEVALGKKRRLLAYGVHLKSNRGGDEDPEKKRENMAKRRAGVKIIKRDLDKRTGELKGVAWETMVVGDFNTDPDVKKFAMDPTMEPLEGWKDLWRGFPLSERTTVDHRKGDPELAFPPICFDRAVVSPEATKKPWLAERPYVVRKGVDIENIYVRAGQSDIHVSDHYPFHFDLVQ